MEGILLETMFDLPGLEGVEQVVIGPEVVEGKAQPLFIYARPRRASRVERQCLERIFGAVEPRQGRTRLKARVRLGHLIPLQRAGPLIIRGPAPRTGRGA